MFFKKMTTILNGKLIKNKTGTTSIKFKGNKNLKKIYLLYDSGKLLHLFLGIGISAIYGNSGTPNAIFEKFLNFTVKFALQILEIIFITFVDCLLR